MTKSVLCILIAILVYMAMMVVIGVIYSKKNSSVGDFYLGGRRLGPIVSAMSAEASDMSSYLLMGLPGLAYLSGCAEVGWTAIGLAIGTYLNWLLVAKRLRVYSQRCGNAITIPDFFSNRYRDNKHVLMGIAAVIILVFFVPYTASGFSACGKLFNQLFGWDYHMAMIISAVIIIAYTCLGGFLAASFTDLIQSIVMTSALVVLVVYGIHTAGGMDNVMENARGIENYLSFTSTRTADGELVSYGGLSIVSTLAWGLGYFGMPHILLRFMAIDDKNKVKVSRRIASIAGNGVCIGDHRSGNGYCTQQAQRRCGAHRRTDLRRHPCLHHVYFGLSAAGGIVQYVGESAERRVPRQAVGKAVHAGGSSGSADYCSAGRRSGVGSEQLGVPCGILRMGRIRRNLWSGGADGAVLETLQQVRRTGWHDYRRRHDLRVEVRHQQAGRRVYHL